MFFPIPSLRSLSEEAHPPEHFLSWMKEAVGDPGLPTQGGQGKGQNLNSC